MRRAVWGQGSSWKAGGCQICAPAASLAFYGDVTDVRIVKYVCYIALYCPSGVLKCSTSSDGEVRTAQMLRIIFRFCCSYGYERLINMAAHCVCGAAISIKCCHCFRNAFRSIRKYFLTSVLRNGGKFDDRSYEMICLMKCFLK